MDIPNYTLVASPYITTLGKIDTFDKQHVNNGYIASLVNTSLGGGEIGQVYISFCVPHSIKGPHAHYAPKIDRFYCIEGSCTIVCRNEQTKQYSVFPLTQNNHQLVVVPSYVSHAIVCRDCSATILSITSEGYNPYEEHNQVETDYLNFGWEEYLQS